MRNTMHKIKQKEQSEVIR